MTTDLSVYRSDREQLLARVRELEAEVEELRGKLHVSELIVPSEWWRRRSCPSCKTTKWDKAIIATYESEWGVLGERGHLGITKSKLCGFWHRNLVCFFRGTPFTPDDYKRWRKPHFHQRCTACGARWIMDTDGWRFD